MKIQFWSVGKEHEAAYKAAINDFTKRIANYFPVKWEIIPTVKNAASLSISELHKREGIQVLELLKPGDYLIALDEGGKTFDSISLSSLIQTRANESTRQLIFLIGGAYGLDKKILTRANLVWSLSPLTFPHQLVRLILVEQVYRACTILRNEKYHHS